MVLISIAIGCVVDTHCFYLLGKSNYDEYQRQAAERFVALEQEGMFCPKASCGASFLWEFTPSNPKVCEYIESMCSKRL